MIKYRNFASRMLHRVMWWNAAACPLFLAIPHASTHVLLLALAVSAFACSVFRAFSIVADAEGVAIVGLVTLFVLVAVASFLSAAIVTCLVRLPLAAVAIVVGYFAGPFAIPVVDVITRTLASYYESQR
jgi:hypothetical protein